MKNFIENIDWLIVFLGLIIIFTIGWFSFIIIEAGRNKPLENSPDTIRKIKICRTYSNDFWRNDIDFIDGRCYYKGKEVEIK